MGRMRTWSKLTGPFGAGAVVGATVVVVGLLGTVSAWSLASSASAQPCEPVPVTTVSSVPPSCAPTLSVVPSANLADGQAVTVTGTGFTPNDAVGMVECEAGATGPSDCDLSTLDETGTDDTGSFSVTYFVTRDISVGTTEIDCALSPCLLGAADVDNYSVAASAAIAFNPAIPPELSGTASPIDKVNTKTGVATITGTVSCAVPTLVYVNLELAQIYHRRWNFTGYGYGEANCTGKKRPSHWKLTVPPGFGLFGQGKASVQVDLNGEIGPIYRNVSFTSPVVLQPRG